MIGQTPNSVAVMIETAKAGSAERMRRCRARRRAGFRCIVIEISNDEISGLVRRGLLSEDDREDLDAIQTAVYAAIVTRNSRAGGAAQ
jgi:hypothetical protein